MADEEIDLPQTQSQSHNTEDQVFSQNADDGSDVWGRLVAKQKAFRNYDLTKESFTIGRATNCDYCLQAPDIKQKNLVQISKRHFQITRDVKEIDSPVFIEVSWLLVVEEYEKNCWCYWQWESS